MNIIRAETKDLAALYELDFKIMGNYSRKLQIDQAVSEGTCYIAKLSEYIAGYLIFDTSFYGNSFISLVIVDPGYRRIGVGRELIRHMEAISSTEKLFTSTNESNEAMKRVCESLGFTRSGLIENLDDGDPEVVYFKRLIQGQSFQNTIKSERLNIRQTKRDDLDFVLSAEANEENKRFVICWAKHKHEEAILDNDKEHFIIENAIDGKPIGYIILSGLLNENQSIELVRIVIVPKGMGYGREAIKLIQKWVFEDLHAHRLWLDVLIHNHIAKGLYESVGFNTEGNLRECLKLGDQFESLYLMSILRSEYLNA